MRVLVHCKGGPGVGVGHVVRSLALAEEAWASGHRVTFVGDFAGDFVRDVLEDSTVDVRPVAASDRRGLERAVAEVSPDVVHLDTYDDLDGWAVGKPALVSNMEDGAFGRRPADLVVDPNFGAEEEPRDGDTGAVVLRGSRYAPLRRSVSRRRGEWQLREEAGRVLVVMGGADPRNLTPDVLAVLEATGLALHVTAITSSQPARVLTLGAMRVDVVPPQPNLPALLAHQDLVVSAAGSTVWELCCLGVPTALVCAVDNQRAAYDRLLAAGAAVGLGSDLDGGDGEDAARLLKETLGNPATRRSLARQAARIVDGLGSWRVVRAWEQLVADGPVPGPPPERTLDVRPATLDDGQMLLRWRNDQGTRGGSRYPRPVRLDEHLAWLTASLGREDRLLLVASHGDEDVGTVRWDRVDDGEWEVSVTVAPESRGQGLARRLLHAGQAALEREHGDVRVLYAAVHERNAASRRLFSSAGYLLDQPADEAGFLLYRKAVRG